MTARTSSASTAQTRSFPSHRFALRARLHCRIRETPAIQEGLGEHERLAADLNSPASRDDVVQTSLNPHDSYKTSILAGLSPTIILDVAGRALNFYAYQVGACLLVERDDMGSLRRRSGTARSSFPGSDHEECARGTPGGAGSFLPTAP